MCKPTDDVTAEVLRTIQDELAKRRKYANGRSWRTDRGMEEAGIVEDFLSSSHDERGAPFSVIRMRRNPDDPPDCEMQDRNGDRIALEVTELVDQNAICRAEAGEFVPPTDWTEAAFRDLLTTCLTRKDYRHRLKGGPYAEFIVVIFTAEYLLDEDRVRRWVSQSLFKAPQGIDRAYLSLDYVPEHGYPLIRIPW